MARILVLTPQVPYPPRQGTALRNWGILRGLAASHEVSLLSFSAPDQPIIAEAELTSRLERIAIIPQPQRSTFDRLRDLIINPLPDLALRLKSPQFAQKLGEWINRYDFDWVLIEGLELADYRQYLPESCRVIFDDHNCEYVLQQRAARTDWKHIGHWIRAAYSSLQWRRLRRFERAVCRNADITVAVSGDDANALRKLVPEMEPLVIQNGLFVSEYAEFLDEIPLHQPAFVFTGTMDFRPNVDGVLWFADQIWPRILQSLPDAHFYIVGRHPHQRLERLSDIPGIIITGSVPDTRPYIRAARVYVVPLLVGGGTRLKLLESTAMHKAVVSTTLGAEGFDQPQKAMRLADSADEFAQMCITLARDDAQRHTMETLAGAYAESYDWSRILPPLLVRISQHQVPEGV